MPNDGKGLAAGVFTLVTSGADEIGMRVINTKWHRAAASSWRAGMVAIAALALGACGLERGQFTILQNQVPSESCDIPAGRTGVYVGEGTLDVAVVGDDTPVGYYLFPLIQNNLPARGQPLEPNRLTITGIRVAIELVDAPTNVVALFTQLAKENDGKRLLAFDEPWAATIDPGGGLLSAGVVAFPGELARRIRATGALQTQNLIRATLRVRALGDGPDGLVESDEFRYPLQICEGCLLAQNPPPACPMPGPVRRGHPCNLAQDALVDCCLSGGRLQCPATEAPAGP